MRSRNILEKPRSVSSSFTIKNVDLWNPNGVLENQNVTVVDGKVDSITPAADTATDRLCLIPSGVDPQVHLRVPGQSQKELPETGLLAALFGGYGAVLNMPNTAPPIDSIETLNLAKSEMAPFEEKYGVQCLHTGCITKGMQGHELAPIRELLEAGAAAITDDGIGIESDEIMDGAFAEISKTKDALLQHAEFAGHGGVLAPGPVQEKLGIKAYAPDAEFNMVERDINSLRKNPNARYHVLHVSSAKTLEIVEKAKSEGLNVTCEATPHHLFFASGEIQEDNKAFKMNPPIRSEADRAALIAGLENGSVDWVATDHAPHEASAKGDDFTKSAFGTLGLETSLLTLLTLVQRGQLSKERLAAVFSKVPAEYLNLPEFGEIKVGAKFNAVLVDPNAKPKAFDSKDLHSLSRNNCFEGAELGGALHGHFLGNKNWILTENSDDSLYIHF